MSGAPLCDNCRERSGPCEGSAFGNPTGKPGDLQMVTCASKIHAVVTAPGPPNTHNRDCPRHKDPANEAVSCHCAVIKGLRRPLNVGNGTTMIDRSHKERYHRTACAVHRLDFSCCGGLPGFKAVDQRPGWLQVWMDTAMLVRRQSTCPRGGGCGAIFTTKDHELIVSGVNGSPRGHPHCYDVGCLILDGHCRRTIHAEINGIIQATLSSRTLSGSTLYITYPPCVTCASALVQAEVARIWYHQTYEGGERESEAFVVLQRGNISIKRF